MFGFQKLDVYRCAVTFLGLATSLANKPPRGYSALSDQLRRASLSIPLNIAEESGKTGRDVARFYAIARGSALECAAAIDAMEVLGFTTKEESVKAEELLDRIVAMLTRMIQK